MIRMRTLPAIALIGLLAGRVPGVTAPSCYAAWQKQNATPFIVFATVFNEQGFALPGAEVRLRRAGETKYRWQVRSDRSGEFAMRVPPGGEYELSISAKGYQPIAQNVDARQTNRVDLTLHMVPASKQKKDEKPATDKPA